jgi:dephospho-CoA kinase
VASVGVNFTKMTKKITNNHCIQNKHIIIGLTGPMAAGKNVASNILEKKGFACVDADILAHDAIEKAKSKILFCFNEQAKNSSLNLLNTDGTINRLALSIIVFKNSKNLATQEAIIHPIVDAMIDEFIQNHQNQPIVINATVLYKVSSIQKCNAIFFVTSPLLTRLKRAKKRDKHSIIHILKRFWSQRRLFSKYVSINSDTYRVKNLGSLIDLEKNINKVLSLL